MKLKGIIINLILHCVNVWSDSKKYDWFGAQEFCRNSSKRLTTTNKTNSSGFIWTGVHTRFSGWIKVLGCYEDSNMRGNIAFQMKNPSVGLCQEYCLRHHHHVYAIKSTECRCLQDDFTGIQLQPNKCNTACSNNNELLPTDCGGKATFSVFSTETGTKFNDIQKNCLSLQCNGKNATFQTHYCDSPLGIICNFTDIQTDRRGWQVSYQSCKSNSSNYATWDFDLSSAYETCKKINSTYYAPLWIGVVRQKYESLDQGELVADKTLINRCQKCDSVYCIYEKCSEKIAADVFCTVVSTPKYPRRESSKDGINVKMITCLSVAVVITGIIIIIILVHCKRRKVICKENNIKEAPSTITDYEKVQKRKISNKNKHYTKDDIRHLGHSNPSYIERTEDVKKQDSVNCTSEDGEYDEIHRTTSRKIERSDIFHYSLHLRPTYDVPSPKKNEIIFHDTGYDVTFTNAIPEYELSKSLADNE